MSVTDKKRKLKPLPTLSEIPLLAWDEWGAGRTGLPQMEMRREGEELIGGGDISRDVTVRTKTGEMRRGRRGRWEEEGSGGTGAKAIFSHNATKLLTTRLFNGTSPTTTITAPKALKGWRELIFPRG